MAAMAGSASRSITAAAVLTALLVAACASDDEADTELTIPPTITTTDDAPELDNASSPDDPTSARAVANVVALGTQRPPIPWACPLPTAVEIATRIGDESAPPGNADVRPDMGMSTVGCDEVRLTVGPTTPEQFVASLYPGGIADAQATINPRGSAAGGELYDHCVVVPSLEQQQCGAVWTDGSVWVDISEITPAPGDPADVERLADELASNVDALVDEAAAIDLVELVQWYRLTNDAVGPETALDTTAESPALSPTGAFPGQRWRFVNLGGGRYEVSNSAQGPTRLLSTEGSGVFYTDGPAQLPGQVWTVTTEPNGTNLVFSDLIETLVFLTPTPGNDGVTVIPFGSPGPVQWRLVAAGAIEP